MALERALKTRDIVLFNVAAIVGMRWVALAAAAGPSSLFLWVLAALVFFIPQGFAVTALSTAIPEEGGLYVWTTRAFGQRQGFLAGWLYWASNITYFPTLTLSTVVFALYIFGTRFAALEQSPDLRGRRFSDASGDRARLQHRRDEDRQVGPEHRRDRPVGAVSGLAPRGDHRAHAERLGDADAGRVAPSELPGPADDPVLRQPLLRFCRARARADDGGRGRRSLQDVPAGHHHLGPVDRRLLPARHDLAPVGAPAERDLDHLGRQPGHHEGGRAARDALARRSHRSAHDARGPRRHRRLAHRDGAAALLRRPRPLPAADLRPDPPPLEDAVVRDGRFRPPSRRSSSSPPRRATRSRAPT